VIYFENLKNTNAPWFEEIKEALIGVLDSGWFILGERCAQFEKEFAEYHESRFAVGVGSGLDALTLALKCCEFPLDSEILLPSNTHFSAIVAVLNCGLIPILVEPEIRTYNIDPNLIETRITSKTKALIAVHLYGNPCSMDQLVQLALKHDLKLIEDCSQAHGAELNGKKVGTFGDFGAFSFYPTKNLGAIGDAGGLVVKNEQDAKKIRELRNYGGIDRNHINFVGINSRLDEIQAAVLSIKIQYLNQINEHKRALAEVYLKKLNSELILPVSSSKATHVYHQFIIRSNQRDKMRAYLLEKGIKTEIHFEVPPFEQAAFQKFFNSENYPVSRKIHKTVLSLPISYSHSEAQVNEVSNCINEFVEKNGL